MRMDVFHKVVSFLLLFITELHIFRKFLWLDLAWLVLSVSDILQQQDWSLTVTTTTVAVAVEKVFKMCSLINSSIQWVEWGAARQKSKAQRQRQSQCGAIMERRQEGKGLTLWLWQEVELIRSFRYNEFGNLQFCFVNLPRKDGAHNLTCGLPFPGKV